MKVVKRSEASAALKPMQEGKFTGTARSTLLHQAGPPHSTAVILVRFEPGARTYWHSHAGGQLLTVVEGQGWAQSRGSGPVRIGVGDSVSTPAGEVHWHGADVSSAMAHIATGIGETTWLEEAPAPS
jgi:quercetin dioxygenase-like cupin family protein